MRTFAQKSALSDAWFVGAESISGLRVVSIVHRGDVGQVGHVRATGDWLRLTIERWPNHHKPILKAEARTT